MKHKTYGQHVELPQYIDSPQHEPAQEAPPNDGQHPGPSPTGCIHGFEDPRWCWKCNPKAKRLKLIKDRHRKLKALKDESMSNLPITQDLCLSGCGKPVKAKGLCRQCYYREIEKPRREAKKAERDKKKAAKKASVANLNGDYEARVEQAAAQVFEPPMAYPPQARSITVDLDEYPDVWEKLQAVAQDQLRTPENQIIWMLKHGGFDAEDAA